MWVRLREREDRERERERVESVLVLSLISSSSVGQGRGARERAPLLCECVCVTLLSRHLPPPLITQLLVTGGVDVKPQIGQLVGCGSCPIRPHQILSSLLLKRWDVTRERERERETTGGRDGEKTERERERERARERCTALSFALLRGVDIVTGTLGRVFELIEKENLSLEDIRFLVRKQGKCHGEGEIHSFSFVTHTHTHRERERETR